MPLFKALPKLSWRGTTVPYTSRTVGFNHSMAKHKYLFKPWSLIQQLGSEDLTFSYTIPMRDGIVKGEHEKKLFSKGLTKFFESFLDKEPGTLIDPIHGEFRAAPASYSENLDVLKRDGVDLQVSFVYAPEDSDLDIQAADLTSLASLNTDAEEIDREIAKVNWRQLAPPEQFVDPFALLDSMEKKLELGIGAINAQLEGIANDMLGVVETVQELQDPSAWPLVPALKNAVAKIRATTRIGSPRGPNGKVIYSYITTNPNSSLSAIASKLGVTVAVILENNPQLASGGGSIKSGTVIKYTK